VVNIKNQLDNLLTQEMDRRSFLKYGMGILLSVLGITGLLRVLLSQNRTALTDTTQEKRGYGTSRYGQ
jgi:hypothetical protein